MITRADKPLEKMDIKILPHKLAVVGNGIKKIGAKVAKNVREVKAHVSVLSQLHRIRMQIGKETPARDDILLKPTIHKLAPPSKGPKPNLI